jgi:enamine deaminase RidA (YjgF/YER057c/UK114 family)
LALEFLWAQNGRMIERQSPGDHGLFEGTPYDYGAIVAAGTLLFTAGACPLDSGGNVVGIGNAEEQAGVALDNLVTALSRYGAGVEDLVKTTVYVVGGRRDLVAVWNVVAAGIAPNRPPSTLLGVTLLGYADQLVEIEGIAAVPEMPKH